MKKILDEMEKNFIEQLKKTVQDEAELEFYLYLRNNNVGCMNHLECCESFRAGYNLAKKKYKKDG